ncbi:MAG: LysM peptidoglycan-binding domain-containing M23 family metallopeptidase [Synergistaceae bacterium]|nr:LysM peptidoglycan-binding domain-containing M23 family metallopeptidase [Synergistaceae bacterium]
MRYNKPNRSSFYVVILCMFFISVSLLIYAEGRSVFHEDELDDTDSLYSGFIAVEFSDVSPVTLMSSFLSITKAYANQEDEDKTLEIPYLIELDALLPDDDLFSSIELSTSDDWSVLPNDMTISDIEVPNDDLLLLERTNFWKEYVVQQKETLSDISMKFNGISIQDIVRANELKNPNQLKEKQILLVPLHEEFIEETLEEVRIRKARVAALKEAIIPLEIKNYTVQEGDSLWSIANSMNVEVDTLIGCNTIGNVLHPKVVLRIPNQDGIFYKIKSGDTVEKIAALYKVQVDRIKNVNPTLELSSLKPGSELFIPGARIEAASPKEEKSNKTAGKTNTRNQSSKSGKSNVKDSSFGSFRWPVAGKISSPFGWRRHPITRRNDFHSALDIRAARGTPIKASNGGQVAYAGWMSGYGKVVVVQHSNGYSTLYGHCSSISVNKGQYVSAGEVIGRVGSTGRATGPHVHFELRQGNRPVNPLQYLR